MAFRPFYWLIILIGVQSPLILPAQEAPVPLAEAATGSTLTTETLRRITTGNDALQAGLPSLAERFYRQVLADEALDDDLRRDLTLNLVTALISQRKMTEAEAFLAELSAGPGNAAANLRRALIAYYRGDLVMLKQQLEFVRETALTQEDLPWYYLLQGLWERSQGTMEAAETLFAQAEAAAVSPSQRADFETEIVRSQIVTGRADEEMAKELERKVESTRGSRVGFGLARQYAVVLDLIGRKNDAIVVLQDQLGLLTEEEKQEEIEILLLIALIAGENSQRGQLALEEILRHPRDVETAAIALNLLGRSNAAETNKEGFRQLLDELIADENHPLSDQLLLLRARFMLKHEGAEQAARDAELLIERFPGSPLRTDAVRLLAFQAWSDEPPRYRAAADYLNQIRDSLPPGRERRYYGRLVADSYFLNQDYQAAAGVYEALLNEQPEPAERTELLLQLTETLAREGRYNEAGDILSQVSFMNQDDALRRWQAEWRLASAMTRAGQIEIAQERISELISTADTSNLPAGLKLRLMWLQARLASDLQDFERVSPMTERIIAEVGATPDTLVPAEDREQIAANALFLRGRALMRLGRSEEAFTTFDSLREKFPRSNAAVLSYLEEARFKVAQGIFNEAQLSYRKIADEFPETEQAAIALFEGALAAEAQGNLTDANRYLEELATGQPGHELVFQARLRQGDNLRKLGEFSLAQQVYKNLIQQFEGKRDDIYLVELYRANSMLAQAGDDAQRLLAAAAELETLFDRPDTSLDFQMETGYLLAHTFENVGDAARAQEVLWEVATRTAPQGRVSNQLGPAGRYWLAKCLIKLSDLLEAQDKPGEADSALRIIVNNRLPGWNFAQSRLGSAG